MTICTPLLFDAVPGTTPLTELDVDATDGLRVTMTGRATGVRGGMREDEDSGGSVLDRAIEDGLEGMADLLGWKPARCSSAD